ncbi:callose synthase 5, partial [Tanacetum coccineum]
VMTPYYSEETLYSKSDLDMENEDGISIMYYLQKIFPAVVELTLRVTINNGRRREVKYRQTQKVLVDIPEKITKHGLSSEITQSSGGSLDMSEGSENSGNFEDYESSGEGLML